MTEPVARIRIELQRLEPKIWRRVDVPVSSTLMALHHIIQVTVGWTNSHLFEFSVGDRIYGDPMPDDDFEWKVYKAKSIRLKTLLNRGIKRFTYLYDFGDHWEHDVIVDEIRNGGADIDYPAFVDGARRCPPEDVGSATGFMEFLEAALDPSHDEHKEVVTWYESRYGKPFDPDEIDEWRVRALLGQFARRRRGPLLSHRSNARGHRA